MKIDEYNSLPEEKQYGDKRFGFRRFRYGKGGGYAGGGIQMKVHYDEGYLTLKTPQSPGGDSTWVRVPISDWDEFPIKDMDLFIRQCFREGNLKTRAFEDLVTAVEKERKENGWHKLGTS